MANQWGIDIVKLEDGTMAFRPDLPGSHVGQPLTASKNDLVTWNNRTNQTITLESIPAGTFLTDPIPAGSGSDPMFRVANTVVYRCQGVASQQHSIEVPSLTS